MEHEFVYFLTNDDVYAEQYFVRVVNGRSLLHRKARMHHNIYGPALEFHDSSKIVYMIFGQRHNKCRPAVTTYKEDGSLHYTEHYEFGQKHNDNNPTTTEYFKNGQIYQISWYTRDKLSRLDGPAITAYNTDGSVYSESYWMNGHRHNWYGPASVTYLPDEVITKYYLWGKWYPFEKWLELKSSLAGKGTMNDLFFINM